VSEDVPAITSPSFMTFHREDSWKAYRAACGNPPAWSDGKRSFFRHEGFIVYLEIH